MGNQEIKIISIDLDGTLLNTSSSITRENIEAIRECTSKNIKVVISSAKTAAYIRSLIKDIPLKDPQICSGGAAIIDNGQNSLFELRIESKHAKEIINYARDYEVGITVACADGNLYHDRWQKSLIHILETDNELLKVDDLLANNIVYNSLMFIILIEEKDNFEIFIKKKLGNKLQILRGGKYFLTILNKNASKLNGIKKILSMLEIKRENLMAIGDSENDKEMLEYAGTGVAMGNSIEELKQVADYIVKDNDHNGVAEAIYKYVLNNNAKKQF